MHTEKTLIPVTQKAGEPWTDEQGITIPFTRISKIEREKERLSSKILSKATEASNDLVWLHRFITEANNTINALSNKEGKSLTKKGGFTWYNFDKSIKVEINRNDTVSFDEGMIASAREKLDIFLSDNTIGTDDIVRQLINTAFHNSKGGLDSKRVLSICKFRSKIKDSRFIDAINLIEASQSIRKTKQYYRVWVKDEAGEYININLQFSNI
jgi:hypothetical protein